MLGEMIAAVEPMFLPDMEANHYAITAAALFNFYNRGVSSYGMHAVPHEGHRAHGTLIAERGYVRG